MKKVYSLAIFLLLLSGCMDYRITGYNSERKFTYRKGKVLYKITDTYTRKVEIDTIRNK
jgi:hypothetical protein